MLVIIATTCLSGCALIPNSQPSSTAPLAPSTTGQSNATSSAAGSNTLTKVPSSLKCENLLSPQDLYFYNPNFALLTADSGTTKIDILGNTLGDSLDCTYQNLSNNAKIELQVAEVGTAAGQNINALFQSQVGNLQVSTVNGQEIRFVRDAEGSGVAFIVKSGYILKAKSKLFENAQDASDFISASLAKL
jgi:hypothetical protein